MSHVHKFKFTKSRLWDLPKARDRVRYFVYDTIVRGFCLMVTKTGFKSFYLNRTINYRSVRIYIGPFPDLPVEMARKKAEEFAAQVALGIDPQDKRRQKRQELTLGELMEKYLERHAKPHKKSWAYDEGLYDRYLVHWAKRRLSTLTRDDIEDLHKKIGRDNGQTIANRVLTLVKTLFNKANEWDDFKQDSPGRGIKKYKEKKRDRYVTKEEMPVFMGTLEKYPNTDFKDYVLVSLFTGVRQANILAMRWVDLSLENMTWLIPETKNGKPHLVDLDESLRPILERRMKEQGQVREWVFPDPSSKSGHINRQVFHWARFVKQAGLKNLVMHDLRHTHATWMVNSGTDLAIVQIALGHEKIETTKGYAHYAPDRTRGERGKAIKAMLNAAGK